MFIYTSWINIQDLTFLPRNQTFFHGNTWSLCEWINEKKNQFCELGWVERSKQAGTDFDLGS